MLNEIRRLFRQSIDAFRAEAETREPEDQIASLLSAIRREMVAARAAIPEYVAELGRATAELEREQQLLGVCERRSAMAQRIGDTETVRVATEFADRHRTRIAVLEQKVAAAKAEIDMRRREADEMVARYKEAEANRFALLAQLRRTAADARMRASTSPDHGSFADFGRMEGKVDRNVSYVDALEDLDADERPPVVTREPDSVEEKLRELKRRMGQTE